MKMTRRNTMIGAAAFGAALVCEPVAAVVVPKQACGCPRIHDLAYGHHCTVHDERGKRWDAYTIEEMADASGTSVDVQTKETEWSCYCHHCDKYLDNMPPPGTKFVWERTSYEYDEYESYCERSYRYDWLSQTTTDWIQMAKDEGFA